MKNIIMFSLCCLLSTVMYAQDFQIHYDAAGNRIQRISLSGNNGEEPENRKEKPEENENSFSDSSNEMAFELILYPNPVEDYLTVNLKDGTSAEIELLVYNANGQLIISEKIIGQSMEIDVAQLVPGNYLLIARTEFYEQSEQFIKM